MAKKNVKKSINKVVLAYSGGLGHICHPHLAEGEL